MFSKEYWQSSAEKLKSVRYLSIMGMMIALKICLSGVYFPVGENLHISITFIIVAIEASILGPVSGMVSGAITDIVSFMIHPDGPFFAAKRVPSAHHTMGGVHIDTETHVLDKEQNIIEGLYAAGEVTGGIHGGNRVGGNAVDDTVVFGRIAGANAADNK